jgi:hypothetical protein
VVDSNDWNSLYLGIDAPASSRQNTMVGKSEARHVDLRSLGNCRHRCTASSHSVTSVDTMRDPLTTNLIRCELFPGHLLVFGPLKGDDDQVRGDL